MSVTDQERHVPFATLGGEGRLVLPEEIRASVGLEAGDSFEITLVANGILQRPCVDKSDEDAALFYGPNWKAELEAALVDFADGRTTSYDSDEAFLASLESRIHADV